MTTYREQHSNSAADPPPSQESQPADADHSRSGESATGRTDVVDAGASPAAGREISAWWVYLASLLLTAVAVTFMTRLWRAVWDAPFWFSGDSVASAAHFRTTMDTGWYEYTPELGAPYGQHYHDFPFSDDLHPAVAKLFGLFTNQVGLVVNVYYVLGYLLVALTATWFFRRCGLSPALTVALAVLYAVAPYHLYRGEGHLFLGLYYCVPLAMGVVLAAVAGKPLWSNRPGVGRVRGVLTGTGAGTLVILILVTLSGAYYAVFTGVLLAAAGLFAFIRERRPGRLGGVVVAGVVLVGTLLAAMLPDILYARANGSNADAFVRSASDTEFYSLKFTALILPALGHRIPAFAELNKYYNTNFAQPGEMPALGAVATVGFLILLLAIPVAALATRRRPSALMQQLRELSFLTYIAFLSATIGGFGTVIALLLTDNIRGWNRMSIFIALLSLAGLGLVLDQVARRLRERPGVIGRLKYSATTMVIGAFVLLIGVADQSLTIGVPPYQQSADEWEAGETFVQSLAASVPADSMIFQLPYMAFPESGIYNGVFDGDQLKLYLHHSDLRWSGGGMKGRPQSDWPAQVAAEDPASMTRDLATIGFQGIVIDRAALADAGAALESELTAVLGPSSLISPNQRYVFFDLQPVIDEVERTTTPEGRAAAAAGITHIEPAN